MGLTALDGRPVLCVVIFSGKTLETPTVTGIDWDAINASMEYNIEEGQEVQFLHSNRGEGSIFPEGPVCNFKGKKILPLSLHLRVGVWMAQF